MARTAADRFPPQIKFIIGNEGCERFSFYGMKNILTFFMIHYLLLKEPTAKANYHLFVSAVYFFPLLGGLLADRLFGKYRTILYLSLVYCAGHACLAIFDQEPTGFYAGLFLIALGSGGIKPCVSALVGDQFSDENKHLLRKVFQLFYWIVNFGSFFASALIPKTLEWFGPKVAFGIPGGLMLLATVILFAGRAHYVDVPPVGRDPHAFLRVVWSGLRARQRGQGIFEAAQASHPPHAVEAARAVAAVLLIFAPIPFFWALFDQKGSTWIVQASAMDLTFGSWKLAPSQVMALNPALVMLLIPLTNYFLYPTLEKRGIPLRPLGRMGVGMALAALAFVIVGLMQLVLDGGQQLSVLWQLLPYAVLTLGEVLLSTTGLEFAYSQAPPHMKSTIMSFWNLTVTFGNLLTALVSRLEIFSGAAQFFFYAALLFVSTGAFALLARGYRDKDYYQHGERSSAA